MKRLPIQVQINAVLKVLNDYEITLDGHDEQLEDDHTTALLLSWGPLNQTTLIVSWQYDEDPNGDGMCYFLDFVLMKENDVLYSAEMVYEEFEAIGQEIAQVIEES